MFFRVYAIVSNLFFAPKTITDQASQYPLMTHGLPAIAGTLSSGACASAQYQSAGDVLTQNVPGSNVMHHQGMCITITMVAVAHAAQYFIGTVIANMHTFCTPFQVTAGRIFL